MYLYFQLKLKMTTDDFARQIENIWRDSFKDTLLFGLPSNSNGVATLTHTSGLGIPLKINGLPSQSPLANNALYSFETINGKYLNLYEILIPDIPGENGSESTAQLYINSLRDNKLNVSSIHYHWNGAFVFYGAVKDHLVAAIHHYAYNMNPVDFSNATIKSLQTTFNNIKNRVRFSLPETTTSGGLTNGFAGQVVNIWKRKIMNSSILFQPSNTKGVAVITHHLDENLMKINSLPSHSPLANNALYSFEISGGKYINLYEVMIPDIPGKNGEISTVQHYVKMLELSGLNVSGNHFHWTGSTMFPEDRGVIAVHHTNIGMNPVEFSGRTLRALESTLRVIRSRV